MLQDTLDVMRRQFLGLSRILSTVTELISEGLMFDDEEKLFKFAAKLLIENHNFQFCAIHLVKGHELQLCCAISADVILNPNTGSEEKSTWVATCNHISKQLLNQGKTELIKRQTADSIYYVMPIAYRDEILATLIVNTHTIDDNHARLVSIFCNILTSVLINARQSQRLAREVRTRTEQLESSWRIAEASSKAKSQFLTNMSHEYLTPLNAIVGLSSLVADTDLNSEQSEYIGSILASSEILQSMVNDILDYSQSESGDFKSEAEAVDLQALLKSLCSNFESDAQRKGIDLELLISPDIPREVILDGKRLKQILNNLISNAIKFTTEGRVAIDTHYLAGDSVDTVIRFSVLDTGIGIQQEDFTAIFDAFHQVDNSNTRRYQGAGFGLAISQRIARLLGAEIEVSSEVGQGSRFSFAVPVKVTNQQLRTLEPTPSSAHGRDQRDGNQNQSDYFTVLLVEDNIINQKLAARLLEKMGCSVDIANDGVDAVDMFSRSDYDVVFMDCQMPNMDGFEATTRIRKMESGSRTPIIALTANSLPEDRARSYQVGMDEFLTKPIVKEKLQNALIKWAAH